METERLCSEVVAEFVNANPNVRFKAIPDMSRSANPKLDSKKDEWEVTAYHWVCRLSNDKIIVNIPYSKGYWNDAKFVAAMKEEHTTTQNLAYWLGNNMLGGFLSALRSSGYRRIAPTIAKVLYSVTEDAISARDYSFEEWCANLGYSDDSIKAKNIYDTCLSYWHDMCRLFGPSKWGAFAKAFADSERDL